MFQNSTDNERAPARYTIAVNLQLPYFCIYIFFHIGMNIFCNCMPVVCPMPTNSISKHKSLVAPEKAT